MVIFFLVSFSLIFFFLTSNRKGFFLASLNLRDLVFYRDYLLLTMLPYLYYWYDGRYKDHYILKSLNSSSYFIIAAIYSTFFIFTFLSTYYFLYPSLKVSLSKFRQEINYKLMISILSFLSVPVFILVLIISYKYKTGIFGLGILDYQEGAELRHYLSREKGIFLSINKIFFKSWVPMISYLFLYLFIKNPLFFGKLNKIMLCISIVSGALASIFFLEKAILFIYLLGFLGVYVYSGGKLKKRYFIYLIFIFFALISIMYVLTYGDRVTGLSYLKDIIIHRVATQSVGSVIAIDYYSNHEFKGLSGISNLLANIVGERFSSPYSDIIKYYVPETASTSGALSSFVTGEAYGLFGLPGVIFSGVIVAAWYAFFESTKKSTLLSVIFVGIYALHFSHHYVASSFFSFIWPIGLIYNIFPFFIILLISSKKKKSFSLKS